MGEFVQAGAADPIETFLARDENGDLRAVYRSLTPARKQDMRAGLARLLGVG